MLAFAVAQLWPDVLSNALTPGWVPTKMGGAGAPDDIAQAHLTQAWLATSDEAAARTTGGYFYHLKRREPNPEARDIALQDRIIDICREISGVNLPAELRKLSVETRLSSQTRVFPVWCVALKLFCISSSYNLSVSFAWPGVNSPPTAPRVGWCLTPP